MKKKNDGGSIALPRYRVRTSRTFAENWQLYLLLLPTVLYFVIFRYIPMLGIQIAFRDYMPNLGYWGSKWVHFKHFNRFFSSYYAQRMIVNTVVLSFGTLIFSFPAPVIIALVLNEVRNNHVKKFAQTVTYAPHFLSMVVVVGLVTSMTNINYGLINVLLKKLGIIEESISFMTSAKWFRPLYIISGVWQESGWNAVVYMAALASVDVQLYEAARVDGAGRLRCIWHVTIPCIAPAMITMLILNCGKVMNVGYEKVLLMLDRWIEDGLTDVLRREGVGCIVFAPLQHGLLTGKYLDGIPADSRAARDPRYLKAENIHPDQLKRVAALEDIADARGQKLNQMALEWVLRDSVITSALIGASRPEQIIDNIQAVHGAPFTQEELDAIEMALK